VLRILFVIALGVTGALRGQGVHCPTSPDSTPIQPVGAFSNLRFTEEHTYGYIVELWRAGKCLFGLFEASEGLSGDTPTGILNQVRHDAATGRLAFAARLTMGVTKLKNATEWVPSRELFEFNGHLGPSALKGKLRQSDQLRPELSAVEQEIVLRLSKQQQEFMIQAENYREWRKQAESILRARGPKW
jgi:hypothetical protein